MKKLSTRMLLLIVCPTILLLGGLIFYVSSSVHKMAVANAEEMLDAHGEALAKDLSSDLEKALSSVQTLSYAFKGVIESGTIPRRESANAMLQQLLKNNSQVISAWMYWEENAFDGRDEEYLNKKGHDHTGQFIPVWSQDESGKLVVEPLIDYDQPGELYENINFVLQTGEATIFEPYAYELYGEEILLTSIAAPVTINGKTVGMTGVDISLEELDKRISQFSFYDNGFAGLMSNKGNVISHQNTELIGTNYFESEAMKNRKDKEQVREATQKGEKARIEGFSSALQQDVYRLFTPMSIKGIETPWSAFLAAPIGEVTRDAKNLTSIIIIVSIIVLSMLIILILIVSRGIVQPIRAVVEHGQDMATGDYSREVPAHYLKRKDEIGDLANIFATLTRSTRELIGQVQGSANVVLESADSMSIGAQQATSAANEVATSIEEVARSAENQMQSAEESARSMEEMSQGVQRIAQATDIVSDTVQEMSDQANLGETAVKQAVEQMDNIQQETNASRAVMERLQEGADKIGNIVAIITDFSEQTNLLALNAAIEAARAGEAGRGFAVVAEEVRKLADETKVSAADIQRLVGVIQAESLQARQSMNTSALEVSRGIERIGEVGQVFKQMNISVEKIAKEIEELSAIAEEMSATSEEIAATSEEIASSAEVSSGHTQQVAAAAEQQLASMEEIKQTSHTMQEMAYQLNEMLKQFRVK